MNRWDIYWADAPFEEIVGSKARPIVICVVHASDVLALKVTSKEARTTSQYDYKLAFWKEAGLTKESVVRVDKIVQVKNQVVGSYIGRIHPADAVEIQKLMIKYKNSING